MLNLDRCWTEHDVVVVDTETLGLTPDCGVCDIAAVRFSGGQPILTFTSLINCGRPIPTEASAIHGITDDMVKHAPSLPEIAGEILKVAKDAVPCAYSADFDRSFIQYNISGRDCAVFDLDFEQWIDVLVMVRDVDRYQSGSGRHKLSAACARRGIAIDGAHRALPDAIATGKLLYSMLERDELKPFPLGKLLAHIAKRKAQQEEDFRAWQARQPKREGVPTT